MNGLLLRPPEICSCKGAQCEGRRTQAAEAAVNKAFVIGVGGVVHLSTARRPPFSSVPTPHPQTWSWETDSFKEKRKKTQRLEIALADRKEHRTTKATCSSLLHRMAFSLLLQDEAVSALQRVWGGKKGSRLLARGRISERCQVEVCRYLTGQ